MTAGFCFGQLAGRALPVTGDKGGYLEGLELWGLTAFEKEGSE